ncbi:MAG: hypothetical protein ABIQ35_00635 [Verrucomicrobiota bacterium]
MTTSTATTTPAPRKKRSIGKIIGFILAILILPIVIGYFVVTSTMFLKRVILPKAGASMNSTITVSDATISPFSQVELKDLEVKPNGKETLLKAKEVRARYNLRDIMGGKLTITEATLVSPIITVVEAADGSSNLDPITKSGKQAGDNDKAKDKDKSKSEKPPTLNIKNISLKDAVVQQTKNLKGGGREVTEISNLNLAIDNLSNGQPGKLNVSADVRMDNSPSSGMTNAVPGSLRAKLSGAIDYKLTADVQPESAKGKIRLDVSEAAGSMADLAKLAAIVDCDLTPTDIRQLSLHFEQGGQALGELRATGPFSFANQEGKLKVELLAIDRHVLNLVGASKGMDFNSTVINSTNDLVLAQKGKSISIDGQINVGKFSVTKKAEKLTTPTLELQTAYQLSVDQNAKSALIQSFNIDGTQNQAKFLRASISKPMPISWGGASSTPENAALQVVITDLNLDDWKTFAADLAPAGKLSMTLDVVSQKSGKELGVDLTSSIAALSAKFGSNQISQADVELKLKAAIASTGTNALNQITLNSYSLELSQSKQSALSLSGSGTVDQASNDADIKLAMQGSLAQLFKTVVVPDLAATAGTVKFDGQITQKKEVKTVRGKFDLADLSGTYAGSPLDRFGTTFDVDLEMNQQNLQIRKLSGALQQAGQSGGSFDVNGSLNTEKKTGDIEMKIAGMNQNALRPFLAKSLGEKQLITISLDANTKAHLTENESSVAGNIDLKNLVVRDPKKTENDAPLAAQVQLDGAMRKDVFDVKQFQVSLSPTTRAKNQLNITGQLDMSRTNAMKGKLLVQSDAFDVTPFYDLTAKAPEKEAKGTSTPAATPASADAAKPNAEPEPMKLPVEQILAEINIGQFYLREVEIKNWRGTAKIEGSHIVLNPFQLTMNEAPISLTADLNLGVKGYVYDVAGSMKGVPLEPLANSFVPEQKGGFQKGNYKGTILADVKIKGAGTTGVNLKKSLAGYASFTFTNANLQIVDRKYKNILLPISLALQIPEISQSPINWLDARLTFAGGNINVTNFAAVSESYRATVQAVVPIADVLTNSPLKKIPVNFELRKALADRGSKLGLANGPVSADGQFVKLPSLVRLEGTLGDPKSEIDKKGLATLAIQAGGGLIGGDAGKVLKGLGGILGGQPATANPPTTSTNQTGGTNNVAPIAPTQNQQLLNDALDLFKKKKKK